MKTKTLAYAICLSLFVGLAVVPALAGEAAPLPEKIFDAPVMPGGTVTSTEAKRVEIAYDLPYEKVLSWYQEIFKNYKDEKYRDWENQMYIEDQGGAPWHSIGISKGGGNRTVVTIVKDNWTWIFSTLFIRFAGVFIVLLSLMVLLMLSSAIMRRFIEKNGSKATG
jgi:hypothetical protein